MNFSRRLTASSAMLLIVAFWGASFEIVQRATEHFPLLFFLALRFSLAASVLAPVGVRKLDLGTVAAGSGVGAVLALAYLLQTMGLQQVDSGKTGILTGAFILFIPLSNWLFFGVQARRALWVAIGISMAGLILLLDRPQEGPRIGDLLVLGCAAAFGLHVTLLEHIAPRHSSAGLAFAQLLVTALMFWCGCLSLPAWPWPSSGVWWAIGVTGLIGSAAAFGIQTWAQKHLPGVEAGIIIMTEPVFAAFFGWLFGESLSLRQWCGALLMISSIAFAGLVPYSSRLRIRDRQALKTNTIRANPAGSGTKPVPNDD